MVFGFKSAKAYEKAMMSRGGGKNVHRNYFNRVGPLKKRFRRYRPPGLMQRRVLYMARILTRAGIPLKTAAKIAGALLDTRQSTRLKRRWKK